MEKKSPTEALRSALLAIPDGQITRTATAAGLAVSQVLRLRRGLNLDIKISTLARLAQAMNVSADELLGLEPPDPIRARDAAERALSADAERKLARMAKLSQQMLALLPPEPETATPQKRRR